MNTDQPAPQQPPNQPPFQQAAQQAAQQAPKRLLRTRDDQMIAGVCGGLARYLGVDPTLVRVAAVIGLVFAFPAALIGYLLAWAIMPTT